MFRSDISLQQYFIYKNSIVLDCGPAYESTSLVFVNVISSRGLMLKGLLWRSMHGKTVKNYYFNVKQFSNFLLQSLRCSFA